MQMLTVVTTYTRFANGLRTPLLYAAIKEMAKLLIAQGSVDVNIKDGVGGRTPLSYAAERGVVEVVKLLRTPNWAEHQRELFQSFLKKNEKGWGQFVGGDC